MKKIKTDLKMDLMILPHQLFHENHMVLNPGKRHFIVNHKKILNNKEITSSNEEKLQGILLDSNLIFDSHITFNAKNRPKT